MLPMLMDAHTARITNFHTEPNLGVLLQVALPIVRPRHDSRCHSKSRMRSWVWVCALNVGNTLAFGIQLQHITKHALKDLESPQNAWTAIDDQRVPRLAARNSSRLAREQLRAEGVQRVHGGGHLEVLVCRTGNVKL